VAEQYHTRSDLPDVLSVFPLAGALLFPRWSLPLNIFEPRYLNMIDDAMAGNRLIGMVQAVGGNRALPDLARVGCVGRVTSYSETDDGRYLISLTGICRFTILSENEIVTPYRQVTVSWSEFISDLVPAPESDLPSREALTEALSRYSKKNNMEVDWEAAENAPIETLLNALSAGCPFGVMEKQALMEAPSVAERAETLIMLLDMDLPGEDKSTLQ